jgi:hypothetical protein
LLDAAPFFPSISAFTLSNAEGAFLAIIANGNKAMSNSNMYFLEDMT